MAAARTGFLVLGQVIFDARARNTRWKRLAAALFGSASRLSADLYPERRMLRKRSRDPTLRTDAQR